METFWTLNRCRTHSSTCQNSKGWVISLEWEDLARQSKLPINLASLIYLWKLSLARYFLPLLTSSPSPDETSHSGRYEIDIINGGMFNALQHRRCDRYTPHIVMKEEIGRLVDSGDPSAQECCQNWVPHELDIICHVHWWYLGGKRPVVDAYVEVLLSKLNQHTFEANWASRFYSPVHFLHGRWNFTHAHYDLQSFIWAVQN